MSNPQRILVIGASRGIGKALADDLSRHGLQTTTTVRSQPPVEAGQLETADQHILDLSDHAAGDRLVAELASRRFDAVVMVAGIMGPDHQDAS